MKLKQLKNYFVLIGLSLASFTANAQTSPRKFIDPANMDLTVSPGNDFYQYASGAWIKKNPVPAKETRWGTFNELREFNIQAVRGLVEAAAADKSAPAGSVTKRVGDFYAAAMDSFSYREIRIHSYQSRSAHRLKKLTLLPALLDHVAYMRTYGIGGGMFGFGVGQDRKNVTKYMVNISQGGTSLGRP
jgi:putative endopeptidase